MEGKGESGAEEEEEERGERGRGWIKTGEVYYAIERNGAVRPQGPTAVIKHTCTLLPSTLSLPLPLSPF